jgi:hypothetical protein
MEPSFREQILQKLLRIRLINSSEGTETHYTGYLTIKCEGIKGKLWIHKDLKITENGTE